MLCVILLAINISVFAYGRFEDDFSDQLYYFATQYVDEAFENATIKSSAYKYVNSNGANLAVNGKAIELRSFADPVIAEPDFESENPQYCKCLVLDDVSGAYMRSESGAISSDILVYEMDYAKAKTDVSSTPFAGYFTNLKGNNNQGAGDVVFDASGNINVFGTYYSSYTENKWYHLQFVVNCTEKTLSVYVDGDFVSSKSIDTNGGFKEWFRTNIASNTGVVQYVDNLKIYILKETEPEFKVIPYANQIMAGTLYGGEVSVMYYPTASIIELCVSYGDDVWETVAQIDASEKEFFFEAYEDLQFKALLRDFDGNVLAESESFSVVVKNTYGNNEKWNIDFEKHTLVGNNEKYVFLDGTQLKSGEDTLHSNRNSASADILIEKKEDSPHMGKSLKLTTTNSSDVMQLNEYQATLTGPIIASEYDVCFENEDVRAVCMQWYYYIGSTAKSTTALSVSDGEFKFGDWKCKFEANKWYNIKMFGDTSNGEISCYIDNKCLGTSIVDVSGFTKTQKLSTKLTNTENGVVWIDNYKVYETAFVPEFLNVASEGKIVTIEFSEALGEMDIKECFSASFGENVLVPVSYSFVDNRRNMISIVCAEQVFTSVPIDISLKLSDITLTYQYTAPTSDFDVSDVSFSENGSTITAQASLVGANGKPVVMIMVSYNLSGEIVAVSAAEKKADDSLANLSCIADNAAMCKVFFVDSWENGFAVKNVDYTYKSK